MPTPRTDAGPRILAAMGADELTHHAITTRTGMSSLAVKSTLNALRRRGEVVRTYRDGMPLYRASRVEVLREERS